MRLHLPHSVRNVLTHLWLAPRKSFAKLIELYQATLSPDHGPLSSIHKYGYCRHHPTCSEYGKKVIRQKGVLKGLPMTLRRLLSCHPWAKVSDEQILSVMKQ